MIAKRQTKAFNKSIKAGIIWIAIIDNIKNSKKTHSNEFLFSNYIFIQIEIRIRLESELVNNS
jgi:hypothetical protein